MNSVIVFTLQSSYYRLDALEFELLGTIQIIGREITILGKYLWEIFEDHANKIVQTKVILEILEVRITEITLH